MSQHFPGVDTRSSGYVPKRWIMFFATLMSLPWMILALLLTLPHFSTGILKSTPRNLIVGGVEAQEGRYSYTVSLMEQPSVSEE